LIKIYYVVLHVYYFELLILPVYLLVHITNSCVPFLLTDNTYFIEGSLRANSGAYLYNPKPYPKS
jgi:hypothetical protein